MQKLSRVLAIMIALQAGFLSASCDASSPADKRSTNASLEKLIGAARDTVAGAVKTTELPGTLDANLHQNKGNTLSGNKGGTRWVIFQNDSKRVVRVDIYFALKNEPTKSMLEQVFGQFTVFQQSKNSSAKTVLPATSGKSGLTVFAEFWGATPTADTPTKSVSIRQAKAP